MLDAVRGIISFLFGSDTPSQRPAVRSGQVVRGSTEEARSRPKQSTAVVLVVGCSGSGKTLFVETAYSADVNGSLPRTSEATTYRIGIGEQRFKLVDTPGFDNPTMSNVEVFLELAKYLLDETRINVAITGVVYIHRAGDTAESRALVQNFSVLSDIFLGDHNLSMLNIAVVPSRLGSGRPISEAEALSRTGVFRSARDRGAKITPSAFDQGDIDNILMSCARSHPRLTNIQQKYKGYSKATLGTKIEERLGYYEEDSVQQLLAPIQRKVQSLEKQTKQKESRISELSYVCSQTEQLLAQSQQEASSLRQQHQQTQKEYASLRSQLQLQESVEQGDVVQALKDLNRGIDDAARNISEFLADTYVQSNFGKDMVDVTALDARSLLELKTLLGHVDDKSSLIASSSGAGMPIEDFFDYAIRTLLCDFLSRRMFGPIHPTVDMSQNEMINALYEDIRQKEPQTVAGRWRASTFKSIYRSEGTETVAHLIDDITREFTDGTLEQLTTHFFGREVDVKLENSHWDRLVKVVQAAWGWNSRLKGEVIVLGDFKQTYYPPLSGFEPSLMDVFEPNPRAPQPESILGTLGLGLLVHRAVGGGHMPEEAIVYRAMVATDSLYA